MKWPLARSERQILVSECSVYTCVYFCVIIEKRIERKAPSQHERTSKHDSVHLRPRQPQDFCCQIHDWIHDILRIPKQKVDIIQINGTKRQVYIKMTDIEGAQDIIQGTGVQA